MEGTLRTREILFLPIEHNIHIIFSPPCNLLQILKRDIRDRKISSLISQTVLSYRCMFLNSLLEFLMVFPCMSLHCKLFPVQYREYDIDHFQSCTFRPPFVYITKLCLCLNYSTFSKSAFEFHFIFPLLLALLRSGNNRNIGVE